MYDGEYIDYLRDESYLKLRFDNSINNFSENKNIIKIINKYIITVSIFILIIMRFYFQKSKQIIELSEEIKKIENYHKICKYGILLNEKIFKKIINPKISVVSAIYNKEKYILSFLRSIQNQFFDNIEIILIDDFSSDNSIKIIEKLQKEDERIVLLKHKHNKGTLISRINGILKSKGEYIIIPDSDDILSNNILNISYYMAKKNNYDIIRYNLYLGKKKIFMNDIIKDVISEPIYQPKLSTYIFYGKGHLELIDVCISNKLVKNEIYFKAINSINTYFLNQYMINWEDGLINFMLYKYANSFFYLKNIGYYYIKNSQSVTKTYIKNIERTIKNAFLYLKFIFIYTNNKKYGKDIASCIFHNIYSDINIIYFNNITKEFQFYYEIINLYLNNENLSSSDKIIFKIIEEIIKKNEKKNYQ